jgi:hypothetical protein
LLIILPGDAFNIVRLPNLPMQTLFRMLVSGFVQQIVGRKTPLKAALQPVGVMEILLNPMPIISATTALHNAPLATLVLTARTPA